MLNPEYAEFDSVKEVDFGEPDEQNREEECIYHFPLESFAREDNFLWKPLKGLYSVDSRKLIAICGLLSVVARVVAERLGYALTEFCLRDDLLKMGALLEKRGEAVEWITPHFNELTQGRWEAIMEDPKGEAQLNYCFFLKAFKAQKLTCPSEERLTLLIQECLKDEDLFAFKGALRDFNFDKLV